MLKPRTLAPLALLALLFGQSSAHADGMVEVEGSHLPSEFSEEPLTPPAVVPAPLATTPSVPILSESTATAQDLTPETPDGVNERKYLNTPAGPTGYVLNARQFEFGFETEQVRLFSGDSELMALHYGLFKGITLDLGASFQDVSPGAKWNFLTAGTWSFAARVDTGIKLRNDFYGSSSVPLMGVLSASHVLSSSEFLHLSLAADSSDVSYNWGGSTSSDAFSYSYWTRAFRLSCAYENRFSSHSGITLSLNPTAWTYGGNSYTGISTDWQLYAGVGFQYSLEHFNLMLGIEAGPTTYYYYEGAHLGFSLASLALNWRI